MYHDFGDIRMVQKVIIHAGLPKTATSFLQENVFPSLPEDRCAFNPEPIVRLLLNMVKRLIAGSAMSDGEVESLKREIVAEMAQINAPALLISVEGLLPLHCGGTATSDRILNVLKQLFENPTLVVFLREQAAWFRSAYSFCLVSKYVLPFDEFVNRGKNGDFGPRRTDGLNLCVYDYEYEKIRQLVYRHFKTVYFFSFEELFSSQEKVFKRLAELIGVLEIRIGSQKKVNQALDERLMVLISKIIRCFPLRSYWKPPYLYVRHASLGWTEMARYLYLRKAGFFSMILARLIHRLPQAGAAGHLFTPEDERRIKSYYAESNARFWAEESA